MIPQTHKAIPKLYEQDYCLWVETTVKQLESGQFQAVDLINLIEEVADLSRRERDKLVSLLTRLLEHLLKLAYWESECEYNTAKWKSEIRNFRVQIKRVLKNSPSLKPYLLEVFDDCYMNARNIIIDLTELPAETFPVESIVTTEQILDENWLPFNL